MCVCVYYYVSGLCVHTYVHFIYYYCGIELGLSVIFLTRCYVIIYRIWLYLSTRR